LRVVPKDIKLHNPSKARRKASGEEQIQTIFIACTAVRAAQAASRIEVHSSHSCITTPSAHFVTLSRSRLAKRDISPTV